MLFYQGSSFGTGRVTNTQSIIGPLNNNDGAPLEMTIVSFPKSNASAKNVSQQLMNCNFNGVKYRYGFSIYVIAVKAEARVCLSTDYSNGQPGNDAILFSTPSTFYFVEVDQYFNSTEAKSNPGYQKQIQDHLGLSSELQNDVKTIVASIKPL